MMKVKVDKYWDEEELEALREILLAEDREAITYLAEQIVALRDNPVNPRVLEKHLRDLLPDLLSQDFREPSAEQAARWAPLVMASIRQQAEKAPHQVVLALQPVMGKLIRAYLLTTLQNAFRWRPARSSSQTTVGHPRADGDKSRPSVEDAWQKPSSAPIKQDQNVSRSREPYRVRTPSRNADYSGSVHQHRAQRWVPRRPLGLIVYLPLVVLVGALLTISIWWFLGRETPTSIGSPDAHVTNTELPPGDTLLNDDATSSHRPVTDTVTATGTTQDLAQAEIDALLAENPLLFEANQQELPQTGRVRLDRIAAILKKYPGTELEIHVYTDDQGPDNINRSISQQRAEAIKLYLSTAGRITPFRIIPFGHGEENPIASNSTDSGRRANRRAEFRITAR